MRAQRLAETLALSVRLTDGPLFRLVDVEPSPARSRVAGDHPLGLVRSDNGHAGRRAGRRDRRGSGRRRPGTCPFATGYLPDAASVLDLQGRLCAGGALALTAIARPADPFRGPADYVLLVQERSGHVVNAARRLAVIPKGFHEPMTDYRADVLPRRDASPRDGRGAVRPRRHRQHERRPAPSRPDAPEPAVRTDALADREPGRCAWSAPASDST